MQHELRAALWRNARLAALGTVVAKVSHDLRGILTPALLTAERLQLNADPRVQRAGEMLVQAVDRAADLVRRTLDYAREGPPPLDLRAGRAGPAGRARRRRRRGRRAVPLRMDNDVDPAILVRADRIQLFRVLTNLLRNAAEAGARSVRISAHQDNTMLAVEIADDGPGLPEAVRSDLFRPFAGSARRGGAGLGLAIARDLMVAHGGDIELVSTGASGTTFRLTLRPGRTGAVGRGRLERGAHCARGDRPTYRTREPGGGTRVDRGVAGARRWPAVPARRALLRRLGWRGHDHYAGLGLFAGAVIYDLRFIKRHFDRLDQTATLRWRGPRLSGIRRNICTSPASGCARRWICWRRCRSRRRRAWWIWAAAPAMSRPSCGSAFRRPR